MASQSNPACRVLYIEDTPEDQQILREATKFADVPVELLTATTAEDRLSLLSDGAPIDVLLLDSNPSNGERCGVSDKRPCSTTNGPDYCPDWRAPAS